MSAEDQRTERPSRREDLLETIAKEEARLARLEAEQASASSRLVALQAELASLGAESEVRVRLPIAVEALVPKTSAEKVKLVRSLFRGRDEVFPTRFVSKKTGKPGYAPACRNKFVKGVCELPKVKCGECPNQAFMPFDDATVVAHLTGRHVMGVYPLLDDETCWFLAVDFDKSSWMEDVSAFVENVPALRFAPHRGEIALGKRRSCLVLLLLAGASGHRPQDGLLPDHRDHVAAAPVEHGVVRPAVPEPGHDAARGLREPDRATAPVRAEKAGELGVPRRPAETVPR